MTEQTIKARCKERVHHGRSGMFRCANDANGDDGLCGTHRAAAARRNQQPVRADALGEPMEVRVTTSLQVAMEWRDGQGPVFPAPYSTTSVQWRTLSAVFAADGTCLRVNGYGAPLKADGTPSDRVGKRLDYGTLDQLPHAVQHLFAAQYEAWAVDPDA